MKNAGFTLIELLVVVLIVGVLAAAAVPQYRLAAAKSRAGVMLPMLRSLQQAQERYYMQNAKTASDLRDLDVSCPSYSDDGVICYLDKSNNVFIRNGQYYVAGWDERLKTVSLYFFYPSAEHPDMSAAAMCYSGGEEDGFGHRVCFALSGDKNPALQEGRWIYKF